MILMYHKIAPETPTMWWVDVDAFYRQMLELQCRDVVYLDDYDINNPRHVVITFDGVYQNVLQYAAPILERFGYSFELFVSSDYIGRGNEFDVVEPPATFASNDELRQLVQSGGRLQWHTRSHPNLKNVTNSEIIARELRIPDDVKQLDPSGFTWFAYPHGEFNQAVIEETQRLFRGALSCVQGNGTDVYQLNRVTVESHSSFAKASVAVIVPSYNYGSFLVEAMESLLRQTLLPTEILISDDASTDNTFEIASAYQKQWPQLIKVNRNETNMGIVEHFRKAVALTSSDYICFLGADNRFRSDYLEKTVRVLDCNDDVGVVYTDYALFGPRAKLSYEGCGDFRGKVYENHFYTIETPDWSEKWRERLKKGNFIHGSSMYRRAAYDAAGGYRKREDKAEDYDLFTRMIFGGWNAQRVAEPILEYRQFSTDQANVQFVSLSELNFYKAQYKLLLRQMEDRERHILPTFLLRKLARKVLNRLRLTKRKIVFRLKSRKWKN